MGALLAREAGEAMTFAEYVRRERRVDVEWHAASMTLRVRVDRSDGTMRAVAVTDLRLVESRLSPVELIAVELRGNPLDVAAVRLLARDEIHGKLSGVPGVRTALTRQPRTLLGIDYGSDDRTAIVAVRDRVVRGFDLVDRAFADAGQTATLTAESLRRAAEQIRAAWQEHSRQLEAATFFGAGLPDIRRQSGMTAAPPPSSFSTPPSTLRADLQANWRTIAEARSQGLITDDEARRLIEQFASPGPSRPSAPRAVRRRRDVEHPPSDATPLAPVNPKLPIYKPE